MLATDFVLKVIALLDKAAAEDYHDITQLKLAIQSLAVTYKLLSNNYRPLVSVPLEDKVLELLNKSPTSLSTTEIRNILQVKDMFNLKRIMKLLRTKNKVIMLGEGPGSKYITNQLEKNIAV